MGNFGNKWNKFVQIFIEKNGYVKVVQGFDRYHHRDGPRPAEI